MSITAKRRLLLATLVAVCLLAVLAGCATPAELCNMRDERDASVVGMGFRISATVNIVTQAELDAICPRPGLYGCQAGGALFLLTKPRFSDVCSLAKFGHEALHEVADHEP